MTEKEILDELLVSLVKSYRAIENKLPFYEANDSKFSTIINSQTKVAHAICNCISLSRDPKLQLSPSRAKQDLAKMMSDVEDAKKQADKIALMTFKDGPPVKRRFVILKDE